MLAAAALLAVAVAFGLAFAMSSPAQADEGDLQAGAMQAQADAKAYDGNEMTFVKEDLTTAFGMFSKQEGSTILYNSATDKLDICYIPKNTTIYKGFFYDASIDDQDSWDAEKAADKFVELKDGKFTFSLDKSYAGKAVPIAPVKKSDGATTDAQYYMAIPALDKLVPTTYDLTVKNTEKMFVGVKATLIDNPFADDTLTFYLNGKSYTYAYAGGQDEAVAAKDAKETDKNWAKQGDQATFAEVTYEKYDGTTATTTKGYPYTIPVTITEGATDLSQNVTMISGTKKTGGETVDNYHARNLAIDLSKKTLTIANASDTATLTVKSELNDVAAAEAGTFKYKGYARPYAGTTLDEEDPLSNDFTATLSISLGDNKTYDKAYVVNYEGKPWLKDNAKEANHDVATEIAVAKDGALALTITNEYDTDPKTTQLNGNIVKVKMHVAEKAPYNEAGTWVDRTFQLDFSNRTTATLAITGDPLTQTMYRMYNPNSGEHLYTASAEERDNLVGVGWNYEKNADGSDAWIAPSTSKTPVYRLYNPNVFDAAGNGLGDHHYTTDKEEYDGLVEAGWSGEGIGWYSDDAEGVGMYRLYNPNAYALHMSGAHHYTAVESEAASLVAIGWNMERDVSKGEAAWYGVKATAAE